MLFVASDNFKQKTNESFDISSALTYRKLYYALSKTSPTRPPDELVEGEKTPQWASNEERSSKPASKQAEMPPSTVFTLDMYTQGAEPEPISYANHRK